MKSSLVPLVSSLLLFGSVWTATSQNLPLQKGISRESIVYKKVAGNELHLDLYQPAPDSPRKKALLVWIHGGAWKHGSKDELLTKNGLLASRLLAQGYAIAAVNYRLSGEAIFPAKVQDLNDAINLLVTDAGKYGLSTEQIVLMGRSAGAHLAALLATSNHHLEAGFYAAGNEPRYTVTGVVDFFGPADLVAMKGNSGRVDHDAPDAAEALLLGASPRLRPDLAKAASPTAWVDGETPPFIIFHGRADQVVPCSQSELLHAALTRAGVENSLTVVDGAHHGDPVFDTEEYVAAVIAFLGRLVDSAPSRTPAAGNLE